MDRTGSSVLRSGWRGLLLVAALAGAGALSFQGSRGIYETTEGRYAECARETLATGDYDDPILNGQPHWTKPPLTYMAIMAGIRLAGPSPWGVRAYLVVAMVLSAAAIWLAGTTVWGPPAGLWAGVVFATAPFMAGAANSTSSDMLTTFWVAAATAAFWRGRTSRSPFAHLAMWIFLGLGFITKGPPALLIPAASLPLAALMLRRSGTPRPPAWLTWLGLGLFLLVGVGWYIEEAKHTPGLLAFWLGQELVGRNISGGLHRNPELRYALTMYLPILLLGTGPWLPLVLWRGRPLHAWWRWTNVSVTSRAAKASLLAGVIVPFIVFSLSRSKLPLYLAPVFVPLALALGRMLDLLIAAGRVRIRTAQILAAVFLALIIAGKGILARRDERRDMTRLAAVLAPVLERAGQPPLFTVARRPLNGLEYHLARIIEFIPPEEWDTHMEAQGRQGRAPRYVIAKRTWERLASTNAPGAMPVEELGRHWLLMAPAAPGQNRQAFPASLEKAP